MRLDGGGFDIKAPAVKPHYVSLCFVEDAARHPRRQTSFSKRLRRRACSYGLVRSKRCSRVYVLT